MLTPMTPPDFGNSPAAVSLTANIPTQDAVLDRIRAYARARDWMPGRLAVEAGLSRGTLKGLFDATWSPSSATVKAIEGVIPSDWRPGDAASSSVASEASTGVALAAPGEAS